MLYGYGGFNISLTPAFSTSNIILLENGGILRSPTSGAAANMGENGIKPASK